MISLYEIILKESIDIYPIDQLEGKGITYNIKSENKAELKVYFVVDGTDYYLQSKAGWGMKGGHSISFGNLVNGNPVYNEYTKSGIPTKVCMVVFSFLRDYVDRYAVNKIEYSVAIESEKSKRPGESIRELIYDKYFEKYFKDFEKTVLVEDKSKLIKMILWTKK